MEEEIYGYGADESDSNYEDYEIVDVSVCKGLEQQELNDLIRELGLSKKTLQLFASQLNGKILVEKKSQNIQFSNTNTFRLLVD